MTCAAILFVHYETASHPIVKPLLLLSECDHDKAHLQYETRYKLAEVASRGPAEADSASFQVSNLDADRHLAESALCRGTFHYGEVDPPVNE